MSALVQHLEETDTNFLLGTLISRNIWGKATQVPVPQCVGSASVVSMMRIHMVLKTENDLNIMLNRITLRSNGGGHPWAGGWGYPCPLQSPGLWVWRKESPWDSTMFRGCHMAKTWSCLWLFFLIPSSTAPPRCHRRGFSLSLSFYLCFSLIPSGKVFPWPECFELRDSLWSLTQASEDFGLWGRPILKHLEVGVILGTAILIKMGFLLWCLFYILGSQALNSLLLDLNSGQIAHGVNVSFPGTLNYIPTCFCTFGGIECWSIEGTVTCGVCFVVSQESIIWCDLAPVWTHSDTFMNQSTDLRL